MSRGGDRGKSPNVTGTQPNRTKQQTFQQPKKAGQGRAGQGSAKSRTPSPRKVSPGTTSKSKDK